MTSDNIHTAFRCSREQLKRWKRAAHLETRSFANWLRVSLDREAKKVLEKEAEKVLEKVLEKEDDKEDEKVLEKEDDKEDTPK